ncbi:MAG: hypothetical protein JWO87_1617 [Phycisphaerales bacterium]|nr:hypothetical protein [Phycisphaerales bacterium]MDB5304377.1 hypothetical protein [Phycisphaerales bacterium]
MRLGIVLILSVICTASARAQQTRPATAPATPKETLRTLNLALRDGDAETVKSLFQTTTAEGKKMVGAMADYAAALADLHRAAGKAFGPEGANTVTGDTAAESADGLAAIDHAEESINGQTATVKYAGATDPAVTLVRVNGTWKLPLSQLLNGADKVTEERRLTELATQTKVANETTADIAGGKYKTPEKAAEVWRARLLQTVLPKPATRPAEANKDAPVAG